MARIGRLETVPGDATLAARFLGQAESALDDVARVHATHAAYNLAYDACHDVGEAVLAAYGYRTKGAQGKHVTLGHALRIILTGPPGDAGARHYDQLRQARNASRYEARPVGKAQVGTASDAATRLIAGARARGVGT